MATPSRGNSASVYYSSVSAVPYVFATPGYTIALVSFCILYGIAENGGFVSFKEVSQLNFVHDKAIFHSYSLLLPIHIQLLLFPLSLELR